MKHRKGCPFQRYTQFTVLATPITATICGYFFDAHFGASRLENAYCIHLEESVATPHDLIARTALSRSEPAKNRRAYIIRSGFCTNRG